PLMLTLKLDGPDSHADLQLPPVALADWWEKTAHAQQPPLALPPGTGKIDIGKINAAGISIEGLHLETGVAPASAASAAAPKRP
ncbi:MAG TPA: membrane assembly protein AsmA, partial [Dyella sp.]